MELPVAFLRDLSDESLTSKKDILKVAVYLGLKKPIPTTNAIVCENPKNIREAARKMLFMWNKEDTASPDTKLHKLRCAYEHLNKGGIYKRVFDRHTPVNVIVNNEQQLTLAVPFDVITMHDGEEINLHGEKYAFLLEICNNITNSGELNDMAISCGISMEKVETATSNWPTDITQAVLEVILAWWDEVNCTENEKIDTLQKGFYDMHKPAVFNRVALKHHEGLPPGYIHRSENVHGIQPRHMDRGAQGFRANQYGPQRDQHRHPGGGTQGVRPIEYRTQRVDTLGQSPDAVLLPRQVEEAVGGEPSEADDLMDTSENLGNFRDVVLGTSEREDPATATTPMVGNGATGVSHSSGQFPRASAVRNSSVTDSSTRLTMQGQRTNRIGVSTICSHLRNLSIGPDQPRRQIYSLGPCEQQRTRYPYDKIPARVLIVNNICRENQDGTHLDGVWIPGRYERATDQLRQDCLDNGYDVDYFKDCSKQDMEILKGDLKGYDFTTYNMFMCVLVCHCDAEGTLMDATQDVAIRFKDLVTSAAENVYLRSKPKIFFKVACRGRLTEDPIQICLTPDNFGTLHIPKFMDIAIAYPTADGYKYMLRTREGHCNAVEVLSGLLSQKNIPRPRTLQTLFTEWNRTLAETVYIGENNQKIKQTPGVHNSLRDDVYY